MKARIPILLLASVLVAQTQRAREFERPARHAARGTHGAVAGGSDYAVDGGMRIYYKGGNGADAGVATTFAASVSEFSHFGFGGEAPILIRTKDGKVHAIAGVGTMPKLATAQFFRDHKVTEDEMTPAARLRWPGSDADRHISLRDRPERLPLRGRRDGGVRRRGPHGSAGLRDPCLRQGTGHRE